MPTTSTCGTRSRHSFAISRRNCMAAVFTRSSSAWSDTDDPAERASQITAAIVAWREAIADLLRAALPPDSDLDAEALADHVFVTFEGAFILCRATGDPGHMRRQLGALRRLFEVLLVQGAA